MSTSSSSEGTWATLIRAPAARASAAWRAKEPGPNDGGTASSGVSSNALVPWPCRSGTITTAGPSPADGTSSSPSSFASSVGQSPGTSSARPARFLRAASRPSAAAADCPASSRSSTTSAPSSRAASAAVGSEVTTISSARSFDLRQGGEHIEHHRRGELAALRLADRVTQALLGPHEALDRQDGDGAHLAPMLPSARTAHVGRV